MSPVMSFLEGFQTRPDVPSLATMLAALLFSVIGGQAVAWVYTWTHTGVSYSRSFVQSLILIAFVVALVMMVVGSSVVVAFGLIGALTIIRFRNVLKDTRDTTFIFMAVAVGLGAGTMSFLAVIVGTIMFMLVMLYLWMTNFGTRIHHDALLRLAVPSSKIEDMRSVFHRHCEKVHLISQRLDQAGQQIDYSYRLLLRNPDRSEEFIRELQSVEGIGGISLLRQEDQSEV